MSTLITERFLGTGGVTAAGPISFDTDTRDLASQGSWDFVVEPSPRPSRTWLTVDGGLAGASHWTMLQPALLGQAPTPQPFDWASEQVAEVLARTWERNNAHRSAVRRALDDPAFARLRELRGTAIALALRRLSGSHRPLWLLFLRSMVADRPAGGTDTIEEAAVAWRRWGREHRFF